MAILPMSPASELFGEEAEDDALFEVRLRRITYNSGLMDSVADEPVSHLQWQTQKVRTLRAATVPRLAAELTPVDTDVDPSFLITFLGTYRAFTSTERLLELLHTRVAAILASELREPSISHFSGHGRLSEGDRHDHALDVDELELSIEPGVARPTSLPTVPLLSVDSVPVSDRFSPEGIGSSETEEEHDQGPVLAADLEKPTRNGSLSTHDDDDDDEEREDGETSRTSKESTSTLDSYAVCSPCYSDQEDSFSWERHWSSSLGSGLDRADVRK